MEKQTFSGNYEADIASLNLRLRVSESFDLVSRQIMIGSHRAMLWFIDGFIKDGLMEKIMSFMMNADEKKLKTVGTTREFADAFVPYVETEVVNDFDRFETFLFSGALGMIVDGFKEAIIIDVRTYPARSVDEPENDKVLRGSHDGLCRDADIQHRAHTPQGQGHEAHDVFDASGNEVENRYCALLS